jgi:hypothetical protein
MTEYLVTLSGGEDSNKFAVELDDRDAALLQRIARISQDLRSGYAPDMTVEPYVPDGWDEVPRA